MESLRREIERLKHDKVRTEKKGNLKEVATICNALGDLYAQAEQYDDAIKEHETELALSRAFEDNLGQAIANRKLGECHCALGDFAAALKFQQRHLELAKSCDSVLEEQRALATIGRTYLIQAEGSTEEEDRSRLLRRAEKAFLQSLEVVERLRKGSLEQEESARMRARLLLNLGLVHNDRGDLQQCSDYIKQAIALGKKHSLHEELLKCYSLLGEYYAQHQKFSQARELLVEAVKAAQDGKDKAGEMEALLQKAQIEMELGDYRAARRDLRKVHRSRSAADAIREKARCLLKNALVLVQTQRQLESGEDLGGDRRCRLYEKLGDAAANVGLYRQAVAFYNHMLKAAQDAGWSPQQLVPIYVSLAQTYLDLKQYSNAVEFYQKEISCRTGEHEQICRTYLNIASAQELQKNVPYEDMAKSYIRALEHARQGDNRRLQVRSLRYLWQLQGSHDPTKQASTAAMLREKYDVAPEGELSDDEDSQEVAQEAEESDTLEDLLDADSSGSETDEEIRTAEAVGVAVCKTKRITRNAMGETPLQVACIKGNLPRVKKLIQQGQPVQVRDNCGWSPLHEACNHGFTEIAELLIDSGADINDRGGPQCEGITPLMDACQNGELEVVEMLIRKGANTHAKDEQGRTAYMHLVDFRERSTDLTEEQVALCRHVEKKLWRAMTGNNPHMPEPSLSANAHTDGGDTSDGGCSDDDLPSIGRARRRRDRNRSKLTQLASTQRGSALVNKEEDEESDTENHPPPSAHSDELEGCLDDPRAAKQAYQKAMAGLGSSTTRARMEEHQPLVPRKASRGPALVTEEEQVDDWLVDDLRPSKRKRQDMGGLLSTTGVKRTRMTSGGRQAHRGSGSPDVRADSPPTVTVEVPQLLTDGVTLGDMELPAVVSSDEDADDVLPRLPSRSKTKPRQTTMSQFATASTEDTSQASPDSGIQSVSIQQGNTTALPSQVTPTQGGVQRVKVRIEGVVLMVPLLPSESPHTVDWLAKAAADRYNQLKGLRPLLSLKTADGAMLSPDDIVSYLVQNNEELEGTVDGWDLPSMDRRYKEACHVLKAVCYRNIQTLLLEAQTSGLVKLSNLALRCRQLQPILRTLQCQHTLKELHLQGNHLGDESVKPLGECLATLSSLQVLDLSCNNLTAHGLTLLDGTLASSPSCLQVLSKVNLSYNPLGDSVTPTVAGMLRRLPALATLQLRSCDLTVRMFQQHRLTLAEVLKGGCVEELDLSLNHLGCTGVELLLRSLPAQKISRLDLVGMLSSYVGNTLPRHLGFYLQQAKESLRNLSIKSCYLHPDHMPDLARSLSGCLSLEQLDLSNNSKLRNTDISLLLENFATHNALHSLSFRGCSVLAPLDTGIIDGINDVPGLRTVEFTCTKLGEDDHQALTEVWQSKWGERARVALRADSVRLDVKVQQ